MSRYREILKSWETPFDKTEAEAWSELQPRMAKVPASKGRVVSFSWKPLVSVAAAAAVIIAVVVFFPKSQLIRKETGAREMASVLLPDNSEMTLNSGSVVEYDKDWSDERTLKLDGQAFFEVQKGSKFSVVTEQGLVEVLGTSFDVYARANKFRVECRTGKVRVAVGKSQVDITPGSAAELSGKVLVVSSYDLALATWQAGEFVYEEEPIRNVLDEVGRQFGVTIHSPEFTGRFYTGRFSNKDLVKALELVCTPMSLEFEIRDGNQVFITETKR